MRKLLLALAILAPLIWANIHTVATISGASSAVAIVPGSVARAAWIQCVAPSANTNNVYFGDSTVSATVGLPIAPGGGYSTPTCANCIYSPGNTYVYVSSGDTAACAWGDGQ
jgi:hypothetical protein